MILRSLMRQLPTRLSSRIAEIRRRAGLTQRQLGDRARINPKSIGAYETGRTEPRMLNLLRIIRACDSTPVEFFDREIRLWEPSESDMDRDALRMMAEERADA